MQGPNVLYVCLEFRPMPTSTRITCWVKRKRSESGMSICPGSAYQVDPELMFQPGSGMVFKSISRLPLSLLVSVFLFLCLPTCVSMRAGTRTRHLGDSSHVHPCLAMSSLHLIAHGDLVALLCHECHECHECPGAPAPCSRDQPMSTQVEVVIHHRQSSSPERSSGTSLSLEAAQDCPSASS